MERAIWQIMVRGETFPWDAPSRATHGQWAWVYLNQVLDYDERVRKIHKHCLPKFHRDVCEVCHEPVTDISKLPKEIRDKVYKPSEHEEYNIEEKFVDETTQKVAVAPDGNAEVDIEL